MGNYEIVIGLEVHLQLLTESKVFCGCSAKFGQLPNTSTCPVCLGLPGSLPVLNEKAFLFAVKTALALNCKIQDIIKFDRKNYYYPDLPKNYQISQYELPLGYDGFIEIETADNKIKKIGIIRVHLEEDAGKLIHDPEKGISYVDYNRSGIPLLEIVTKPDIRSPEEAYVFLIQLKSLLKYLKVSDCNMEEGSLRCDANISIRKKGERRLGVKTELKNMNSFKAVRNALLYEANRQKESLENGKTITQETRLWNPDLEKTISMRTKEEAQDYRYFPEPDLVPFTIDKSKLNEILSSLPESPRDKRERFILEYKLTGYDADILTRDLEMAQFFEETVRIKNRPKEIANWLIGDITSVLKEMGISMTESKLKPSHLAELIKLIKDGDISGKMAKGLLPKIMKDGVTPKELVEKAGLKQIQDETELMSIIDEVLKENEKSVNDYKRGKKNAVMYLVGQVMKKTRGQANPKKVNELLEKRLSQCGKN